MNKLVLWDDSYLLGIAEIDVQHKKLVSIATELYTVATTPDESYKLDMSRIIKKLTNYTEYHFEHEETYMRDFGFPQADAHHEQHKAFVTEIYAQINRLPMNDPSDGLQIYNYLIDWLMHHIGKSDRIWAAHILSRK